MIQSKERRKNWKRK